MAGLSYQALIDARGPRPESGQILRLPIPGGCLGYNPCLIATTPRVLLAVRRESRESFWLDEATWDPEIVLVAAETPTSLDWAQVSDDPVLRAIEDPFAQHIVIDSIATTVLGGVTLDRSTSPPTVVTVLHELIGADGGDPVATPGAEIRGMKDVRMVQLDDGRIAACGRPQGGAAGVGRISLTVVDDWRSITTSSMAAATLLDMEIAADVKIGTNELYRLGGNTIGALGHVAIGEAGTTQHYAAVVWTFDVGTGVASAPRIIATANDFPGAQCKNEMLRDVVFPGSLLPLRNGASRLFAGVGDACVGVIDIPDPFQPTR